MISLQTFVDEARRRGWTVQLSDSDLPIPAEISEKYGTLPDDVSTFLRRVETCLAPGEQCWFNTVPQIMSGGFPWNQFELISLDAASGDEDWTREIRTFWRHHMPVVISVRSGYAYLALEIGGETNEGIVEGWEPEFEEPSPAFSSFSDLIRAFVEKDEKWMQFAE